MWKGNGRALLLLCIRTASALLTPCLHLQYETGVRPQPWPGYVPKVPTTPFRDQVVNLQALLLEEADPALALLCPVRALWQYVDRSQSFRTPEHLIPDSKMAPGNGLAGRRSVFRMSVFCLFILLLCFTNSLNCSRLIYDRFTLLSLRSAALEMCSRDLNVKLFAEQSCTFQPPRKACHKTGCVCWKKRRRRWRGTRAGVLVKRKKLGILNRKVGPAAELRPSYLIHVLPDTSTLSPWTTWRGKSRGGVVYSNLRPVRRAEQMKLSGPSFNRPIVSTTVHMALINARNAKMSTILCFSVNMGCCVYINEEKKWT